MKANSDSTISRHNIWYSGYVLKVCFAHITHHKFASDQDIYDCAVSNFFARFMILKGLDAV